MIPRFRSPLTLVWEITDSCNLACVHCRAACDGLRAVRRDEAVESYLLDYVAREKVFVVNISGGEPLLHPDLAGIVARLTADGVHVGVSTNGFLWPRNSERLIAAGLRYVQISLDGPPEVHNRIRRNPQAYDAAIAGLRDARRHGIRTQMNTVLSRLSAPHLDWIYALASELEVQLHVRRFIPVGTGKVNRELIPGPEEHLALIRRLVELQSRGAVQMDIEEPLTARLLPAGERPQMGCGAGTTQIGIAMNGDIFPCIFFRHPIGNVLREGLDAAWPGDPLLESIRDRDTAACSNCHLAAACGGCRACAPTPFADDPLCPRVTALAGDRE